MNAKQRRVAMRKAFRQGAETRVRYASVIRLAPAEYHVDVKVVHHANPYRWPMLSQHYTRSKTPRWDVLAREFERGWGPL